MLATDAEQALKPGHDVEVIEDFVAAAAPVGRGQRVSQEKAAPLCGVADAHGHASERGDERGRERVGEEN